MPESTSTPILGKIRQPAEPSARLSPTRILGMLASWATVALGGILLAANVIELGGVGPAARELSAWTMALLALAHGVSVTLNWDEDDSGGLRLPRWLLGGLPLLAWLFYLWHTDYAHPWLGRDTFYLAAQAWLLAWVVAATPGNRAMSWAWLLLVGGTALVALLVAFATQRGTDALALPLARELPEAWHGRWSGTTPTPGAFGLLMLLGGAPLLVMAFSRRLAMPWRIVLGYAGVVLLYGAAASFSLGAWLGLGAVLLLLPVLVGHSTQWRMGGWGIGILVLAVLGGMNLFSSQIYSAGGLLGRLQAGEPTWGDSWQVLSGQLNGATALTGTTLAYPELSQRAGVWGNGGGLSYGWGDWPDAAASWGLVGAGFAAVVLTGFLVAGWIGWARLPFLVITGQGIGSSPRRVKKHSPTQPSFTPETKILLAAGALALTAAALAITSVRALNVPVTAYAFAVVAGVLARNIPQRGGTLRLPAAARGALGLAPALAAAYVLGFMVAPAARADVYLERARARFAQIAAHPAAAKNNAGLLKLACQDVDTACKTDPGSLQVSMERAWFAVVQASLDPKQFSKMSKVGLEASGRVLKEAPQAATPHITCGLACLLKNDVKIAGQHLRRALDSAPYDPRVQYYAVAVLALDPESRLMAEQLVDKARESTLPPEQLRRLEAAYAWGSAAAPSAKHNGFRPPPLYLFAEPWPPTAGLPRGTARASTGFELPPEIPAPETTPAAAAK